MLRDDRNRPPTNEPTTGETALSPVLEHAYDVLSKASRPCQPCRLDVRREDPAAFQSSTPSALLLPVLPVTITGCNGVRELPQTSVQIRIIEGPQMLCHRNVEAVHVNASMLGCYAMHLRAWLCTLPHRV